MRRRFLAILAVVSCVLCSALPSQAASFSSRTRALGVPLIIKESPVHGVAATAQPASPMAFMLQFAGQPAIAAGRGAAARRQYAANTSLQNQVIQQIAASGAQVLYRSRMAYNGVAVLATPQQVAALQQLSGVVAAHPISPKQRLDDQASRARFAAMARISYEATGRYTTVAIADTGIDYTHALFGGAGTASAYANNDPTVVEQGSFPTSKVLSGYDLAGDSYNGSTNPVPTPDADPLDCSGQGTRFAGFAAGYGVTSAGSTYRGSYDSRDFSGFRIQPGVAPEAALRVYKIFGCDGTTTLLGEAVERALDPNGDGDPSDHVDALGVALGTPFGSPDDADALILANAARAGVVVVAAAGDAGDSYYAVSTPAISDPAIAVGTSLGSSPDVVWSQSVRGPRPGGQALKPDLVAPGVDIVSAQLGTGNGTITRSGSAQAAAFALGAAARVRERFPDLSVSQIKALLMNTARSVITESGEQEMPSRVGAGSIDLGASVQARLLGFNADAAEGVALVYGTQRLSAQQTFTGTITLVNTAFDPRTVQVSATVGGETGVEVQVPSSAIEVPSFGTVDVPVTVVVDPSALGGGKPGSVPPQQTGIPRFFKPEAGGYISLTSEQEAIRVPLQMFPYSASAAQVAGALQVNASAKSFAADLENTGARNAAISGADSNGKVAFASAFELVAESPVVANTPADLQYIGIGSNYMATGNVDSTAVFFAMVASAPWNTPNDVEYRVYIDTNLDGTSDYLVVNTSLGTLRNGQPDDVFVSPLYKLGADGQTRLSSSSYTYLNSFPAPTISPYADTSVFDTRVLFQAASARFMGLSSSQTTFQFYVESRSVVNGVVAAPTKRIPTTGWIAYDLAKPALAAWNTTDGPLANGPRPVFVDRTGNQITGFADLSKIGSTGFGGMLVLHHHNPVASQAEIVSSASMMSSMATPRSVFLPVISR